MIKRYSLELVIGLPGFVAIFLFAEKGMAVLALLAFWPFLGRKKADERERQLFYKTGNITAVLTLLFCVVFFFFSDYQLNGFRVGDNWLLLAAFSLLVSHGVAGLIIFYNK